MNYETSVILNDFHSDKWISGYILIHTFDSWRQNVKDK